MDRKKREKKKVSIISDPAISPYYISKDEHSYTVLELSSNEKSTDKMIGHYSTLGGALKKLSELKANLKPQYDSIREYLEEYNNKYNNLKQILNIGV